MQKAVPDPDALGRATLAAMGPESRPVPVLLVHGGSDAVVSPANLDAIARQWAVVNAPTVPNGAMSSFSCPRRH